MWGLINGWSSHNSIIGIRWAYSSQHQSSGVNLTWPMMPSNRYQIWYSWTFHVVKCFGGYLRPSHGRSDNKTICRWFSMSDWSISSALSLELLQPCAKPLLCGRSSWSIFTLVFQVLRFLADKWRRVRDKSSHFTSHVHSVKQALQNANHADNVAIRWRHDYTEQ